MKKVFAFAAIFFAISSQSVFSNELENQARSLIEAHQEEIAQSSNDHQEEVEKVKALFDRFMAKDASGNVSIREEYMNLFFSKFEEGASIYESYKQKIIDAGQILSNMTKDMKVSIVIKFETGNSFEETLIKTLANSLLATIGSI